MSIKIIQNRLDQYQPQTQQEEENALREITQEIALLALSRCDFFNHVAFHGGTALRILYGLPRFSEDLDFALLMPDKKFLLSQYLKNVADEFSAFGYKIELQDRSDANQTVKKAFLKDDSLGKVLLLNYPRAASVAKKIRIKLEVDINPPLGAKTAVKYLDFPVPFSIVAHEPSSTFAGKLHALLCRDYVKGRDWFDFAWYVDRKTQINYAFLKNALFQLGPWQQQKLTIDKTWVLKQLKNKINNLDWGKAVEDVQRFIKPAYQDSLALWGSEYFLHLHEKCNLYLSTH